jgi:hypothetical protein
VVWEEPQADMNAWGALASVVLAVHLTWIVWVIFGWLVARNRPLLRWFHFGSLIYGIVIWLWLRRERQLLHHTRDADGRVQKKPAKVTLAAWSAVTGCYETDPNWRCSCAIGSGMGGVVLRFTISRSSATD